MTKEIPSEKLSQKIPLSFIANPSELDGTILYLASNKASKYVTGTVITVDGGIAGEVMNHYK
jgi:NAD(P)-dependent dehydrogenase (short-subunit alcohol dehydrogenase family)